MARWYKKIFVATSDEKMFEYVLAAADYYESEYEAGRKDMSTDRGQSIIRISASIPGWIADRFSQLQDMEMIIQHLEAKEAKAVVDKTQYYLDHYARKLTETTAKKYADVHDDVQVFRLHRQYISNIRNQYLGLIKSLDALHFQVGHIVKLKAVGLDDATL